MQDNITTRLAVIADGGVTSPAGVRAGGIHAGFRKNPGRLDMALVEVDEPCSAAGAFTTNKFCAAPVTVSRAHLSANGCAPVRAICINSGNANAATGEEGLEVAEATCRLVADTLGCEPGEVLVASTGVIGQLPSSTTSRRVCPSFTRRLLPRVTRRLARPVAMMPLAPS